MSVDGHGGAGEGGSLVERICLSCVRSLPITSAAVSVMTASGHRGVVFASDDLARPLEDVQFTLGEGPGVDAFAGAAAVLVADLSAAAPASGRWPGFAAAARDLGVRSVFAFPLHLGAAALGALTLYRGEPGALGGPDLGRALRLADGASVALLDLIGGAESDSSGAGDGRGWEVEEAEFYRSEVYQAAGMLMDQIGVGIETAMVRLRAYAFASGRPTSDVARDIVRRDLRFEAE